MNQHKGQKFNIANIQSPDSAKLNGAWTVADKRWVEPVKLLCIIMFDISKIRPKSILGLVKAQKVLQCLNLMASNLYSDHNYTYHKTSNIRGTLFGNKIVDHSDVVGASPVTAAPTISSFST